MGGLVVLAGGALDLLLLGEQTLELGIRFTDEGLDLLLGLRRRCRRSGSHLGDGGSGSLGSSRAGRHDAGTLGTGGVAALMFGRGWDKVDRRGMAFMQASGVQFTKADAACVKAVQDRTAAVEDRWAAAAEAKGLKDAKKVLAEFRADIKKLEK